MREWFTEILQLEIACMLNQLILQPQFMSNYFVYRIDMNMLIKVADFGLAVNIEDKNYYRLSTNTNIKLPVMWMAPESLSTQVFSEKSDVVSLNYR